MVPSPGITGQDGESTRERRRDWSRGRGSGDPGNRPKYSSCYSYVPPSTKEVVLSVIDCSGGRGHFRLEGGLCKREPCRFERTRRLDLR